MCGIVAYAGKRPAVPILLDGLRHLEYRGYDSAGIAVVSGGTIEVSRSTGKLSNLRSLLRERPLLGSIGLGHTRWATHGEPTEANAHPHTDCGKKIAVIHNGIIENYLAIKNRLQEKGHTFVSDTDTEVMAHLIEEKIEERCAGITLNGNKDQVLVDVMRMAIQEVRGAYALAVIWSEMPGTIVATRVDSPLVVGLGEHENFMASDVPAFLKHTRKVIYLEDGELAVVRGDTCTFFDRQGAKIEKSPTFIDWNGEESGKNGYRHFMLKEIYEQPKVVENTIRGRLVGLTGEIFEQVTSLKADLADTIDQIHIIACGTSWHAGIVGKYLFERYARIQTQVEVSSEFRYRKPVLKPGTLVIAISQSGETADTLAAIRLARESGSKILSICNTIGAAIPRSSDFNFQTHCGREYGVASTKAFVGQLIALNLLCLHFAARRGVIPKDEAFEWASQLKELPGLICETLKLDPLIRTISGIYSGAEHFLFIGRGVNYPVALEGALKLKEISYIHGEGYAAGEMKHGPLALVDSKTPVLAIATESEVFEKVLSNIEEARARGAKIIALGSHGDSRLADQVEHLLEVPAVLERVSPILNVIPLQLLAYHCANIRGCDIDQPRNLAKSVTVE